MVAASLGSATYHTIPSVSSTTYLSPLLTPVGFFEWVVDDGHPPSMALHLAIGKQNAALSSNPTLQPHFWVLNAAIAA